MLYYFQPNVILLSVECYITFSRMLYYFQSNVILLSVKCYITFSKKLYYFLKQGIFFTAERYIPFGQMVYTLLPGVKVGAHAKALQWVRLNLHSRVGVLEVHPSPQVRSARSRLLGPSQHKANETEIRYRPHRPCSHG